MFNNYSVLPRKKKHPGGTDVLLSIKFFLHVKQSSLNKIWCSYRRYMWWFGTTLKTLLGVVLVDAGKILQLARHFGPWGTVLGPFGSQNVYLNALNPLAHRVIFLTCTLQIKKAELLDPLPPPPPLLPDLMSNKLTWELLWFYLVKYIGKIQQRWNP